jgi:cytochrome c oxidase accessory protein FixG
VALWTGLTFVGFFTPIRDLFPNLIAWQLSGWETFWILFYAFATYGNAGYLREQVCKYMCPYARFQGAMFDPDTLIISYDQARGEPRATGKKREGLGDCIECTMCVQVCPTGIDIRDGLQIDCIACGACIDACDEVMTKVQKPLGLIRYSTANLLEGKPSRILRPRVAIYAALLLALMLTIVIGISQRKLLLLDVLRDRNALYRVASDGRTENAFTLKITNKQRESSCYDILLIAPAALQLSKRQSAVCVDGRSTLAWPITITALQPLASRQLEFAIALQSQQDPELRRVENSRFFSPIEGSYETK